MGKRNITIIIFTVSLFTLLVTTVFVKNMLRNQTELPNKQSIVNNEKDTTTQTKLVVPKKNRGNPNTFPFYSESVADESARNSLYIKDTLRQYPIPTNRIWSSVVFSGKVLGLFTFPLAFQSIDGGLALTSPNKKVEDKTVFGQIGNQFLKITGEKPVTTVRVESYSDISVELVFQDEATKDVFSAIITQGSPYIYIQPIQKQLTIKSSDYSLKDNNIYQNNSRYFGVFTDGEVVRSADNLTINFNNPHTQYLTLGFFNKPELYNEISQYAQNRFQNVYFNNSNENQFDIKYHPKSSTNQTIFGLLPHQQITNNTNNTPLFEVETIRGVQKFYKISNTISFATPKQMLEVNLELKPEILEKNKQLLYKTLDDDVKGLVDLPKGSYFGGKYVAKIARLLQIAKQLNDSKNSTILEEKLYKNLSDWFQYSGEDDQNYFLYDKTIGGLIAQKPEFGSDEYNDHHFHYGYFVYASSILAQYNPDFILQYGNMVDLLIKDFGNNQRYDKQFPFNRAFDFYEGHSWASGKQTFADGNNQESSSEAINAWYAVWLWGKTSGDVETEKHGRTLYNMEVESTLQYYLKPIGRNPSTGVLWGGKVDYATFFSGEDLKIQGIQHLPFTPGSTYLSQSKSVVTDLNGKFDESWLDIAYMYRGIKQGITVAPENTLKTITIDDGNSRSNMYVWLLYWEGKK